MIKFFNLIFIIFSISLSSSEQKYSSSQNKFSLLVHKTPTCGCCKKWVNHLEANNFSTMIKDHQNLQKVKEQHSIKPNTNHVIRLFLKTAMFLKVIFQVNL